ncbi:MFS transporter [Pseudoalteromonas sp. SG45-5]|uniref:MFS transporter n=1 Tax=unclassified Pseudoalteromonas TaxID=194690 RepID=UPI0015F8EF35|nr:MULTISPECIES: MFS transporter [unclassified Pseudoalteromonas]MBB1386262.1 MFS transporter [Pseudoalteromonas sp. SG45-5]MBB1394140.1 MFS transporter [Pseudoalteromonas sp. SG44-4]MBB1448677.1 MFS transporter [Pseudoalteromonas sp. SG41-6]
MRLPHLLVCSVFIFFVLYAPQPLLSLFANEFSVAPAVAGSLMTVTMLPLAIAPLVYGVLLAKHNPLLILRIAMVFLGLSCLLFIYVPSFELLLLVRFLQGLTLPAALTAMTSYIGMSYRADALQKNMTLYISSSIIGGYFGRVLAALFSDLWHWQSFYYVIAFMLIFLALTIKHSRFTNPSTKSQLLPLGYIKQLKEGAVLKVYGAVFCMFFCFAALLNYLPFILQNTFLITNTRDIGLVYSGYLVGALASIAAPWLLKKAPSAWHLLAAVFSFYSVSIILLMSHQLSLFLIAFTLFCGAMFVIHSTAAPLVNKISKAPPSVTNGGYVSFYYSGGALGSLLPGVVYQHYGQTAFMLTLLTVCLCGLSLIVWAYLEGKNTTRG